MEVTDRELAQLEDTAKRLKEYAEAVVRGVDAQLRLIMKLKLRPCNACGRRVTTPCDNAENYYESGPWDFACEDLIKERRDG